MEANIIIAIMSALTTIIVVALTYLTNKQREREAEWRKEKLEHYKNYILALSNTVGSNAEPDAIKKHALAFNTIGLFSSQEVIDCLHEYQQETKLSMEEISFDKHDELLSKLILAMRKDLKLKPKDDIATFSYRLISPKP